MVNTLNLNCHSFLLVQSITLMECIFFVSSSRANAEQSCMQQLIIAKGSSNNKSLTTSQVANWQSYIKKYIAMNSFKIF